MATRYATALLYVAALLTASASASRLDMSLFTQAPRAALKVKEYMDDEVAIVNFKCMVPPDMASEFVEAWNDHIASTINYAKGLIMVSLTKPTVTNTIYYSYSEWESMEDFDKFFHGKDSESFTKFVADHDIRAELQFLYNSTGMEEHGKAYNRMLAKKHHMKHNEDNKHGDDDDDTESFVTLSTIIVKPSKVEAFINQWRDAAMEVANENGNEVYSLRQFATNNQQFYLYASWESVEAWRDHLNSDHVHKLAEWTDKNGVVFFTSPISHMEE